MDEVAEEVRHLAVDIRSLVAQLVEDDKNRNAITVTHTQSSNATFFVGVAVAACIAAVALMLAFMIIENRSYTHLDNQVDQLRAWNDVHSKEISRIQAQLQEKH